MSGHCIVIIHCTYTRSDYAFESTIEGKTFNKENLKITTKRKVQSRHKNSLSIVIASIQLLLLHRSCRLHTSTTTQPYIHDKTLTQVFLNVMQIKYINNNIISTQKLQSTEHIFYYQDQMI